MSAERRSRYDVRAAISASAGALASRRLAQRRLAAAEAAMYFVSTRRLLSNGWTRRRFRHNDRNACLALQRRNAFDQQRSRGVAEYAEKKTSHPRLRVNSTHCGLLNGCPLLTARLPPAKAGVRS